MTYPIDHLSAADVAGYLAGDLLADDRRRVEVHLDACAECRAELIQVERLARSAESAPLTAARSGPRYRWILPVALAAGIAGVVLVRQEFPRAEPATIERPATGPSESVPLIATVTPANGASLPARGIVFRWRAHAADTYLLTVLTETGEPLWTAQTQDTSAALPSRITLEPGHRYFWRVEAVVDGVTATTGIHRFQLVP